MLRMNMNIQSLNLRVGPLNYRLIAHDTWAMDLLERIRSIIDNETGSDIPQKQIHMMQQPLCEQTLLEIEEKPLPKALLDCATEAPPRGGDSVLPACSPGRSWIGGEARVEVAGTIAPGAR